MKSMFKLFLLALALPVVVNAEEVELKKDVVGAGGILNTTVQTADGEVTMSGTFGQVAVARLDAGSSTSDVSRMYEGYWGPIAKIVGSVDPQPELFDLVGLKNYPNPVSVKTTISYNLPDAGEVTLRIFDVNGNMVAELGNGLYQGQGENSLEWDLTTLSGVTAASGSYLYELSVAASSGNDITVRNIMVVSK